MDYTRVHYVSSLAMDYTRFSYVSHVYQRIVGALPRLSWMVKGDNKNREHQATLWMLSDWVKESRLLPLCLWIWLENANGFPNVVEFLATCPIVMFETALKDALQTIAYVHFSTLSGADPDGVVDLPNFSVLLDSLLSWGCPHIDFKVAAPQIWEELNIIMSNVSLYLTEI